MDKERKIQEEVEKTMNSLDQFRRLEGNPFLFTRIQERLGEKESTSIIWSLARSLQPAIIALLLLFNVFAAYELYGSMNAGKMVSEGLVDDYKVLSLDEQSIDYYIP